ncbi:hypothetical protein ACFLZP_00030 [Patescibacteria group bacterium]
MEKKRLINIPLGKKEFFSLREDSFVWFSFWSTLLLIPLMAILILLNWTHLPPQIPLFFSRPWGESQLSSPSRLWLLPLLSTITLLLNLFLAIIPFKGEIFMRRILAITSTVTGSLYFWAIYKIISLVG